ncbi:MAG TPA: Flp pilus assembly protein CpaB [Tepidisphaeraceae bacterium]|jgi:pilus assembly protein CpaB|nr:Flp pilus assembly protein CpaB [Tepidisphaeraceae bacterium]
MKWKKWAPAVLAIVLGGVAAMLARNMMAKSRQAAVAPPQAVQIVTATGSLMVGQEIKPDNVTLTTIPSPTPPPDAFTNTNDVVGHVLTASLIKGQNVVAGNLAPTGVAAGLQSLIPAGKRALTINVDEGNAQAGMLLPGCRIDILVTIANGRGSLTRPIVTNALIQATGVRLTSARPEEGKEPGPYHTLTLIVTLHEAELIELASSNSKLRMLLRGTHKPAPGEDDDTDADDVVTVADLIGSDSSTSNKAPVAMASDTTPTTMPSDRPAPRPKWTVELIKGAGSSPVRVDFDMPREKPIMVDTDKDARDPAIPGAEERPER